MVAARLNDDIPQDSAVAGSTSFCCCFVEAGIRVVVTAAELLTAIASRTASPRSRTSFRSPGCTVAEYSVRTPVACKCSPVHQQSACQHTKTKEGALSAGLQWARLLRPSTTMEAIDVCECLLEVGPVRIFTGFANVKFAFRVYHLYSVLCVISVARVGPECWFGIGIGSILCMSVLQPSNDSFPPPDSPPPPRPPPPRPPKGLHV